MLVKYLVKEVGYFVQKSFFFSLFVNLEFIVYFYFCIKVWTVVVISVNNYLEREIKCLFLIIYILVYLVGEEVLE